MVTRINFDGFSHIVPIFCQNLLLQIHETWMCLCIAATVPAQYASRTAMWVWKRKDSPARVVCRMRWRSVSNTRSNIHNTHLRTPATHTWGQMYGKPYWSLSPVVVWYYNLVVYDMETITYESCERSKGSLRMGPRHQGENWFLLMFGWLPGPLRLQYWGLLSHWACVGFFRRNMQDLKEHSSCAFWFWNFKELGFFSAFQLQKHNVGWFYSCLFSILYLCSWTVLYNSFFLVLTVDQFQRFGMLNFITTKRCQGFPSRFFELCLPYAKSPMCHHFTFQPKPIPDVQF